MTAAVARVPAVAAPFSWQDTGRVLRLEAGLPGARAAFTTRLGGVSEGAYRSLNLGILTDDEPDRVVQNRGRLAAAVGRDPEGVAMGLQVHGAEVLTWDEPGAEPGAYSHPGTGLREADAHVTASPSRTPLVLVADCAPLALAGEGAVAAVHCGWRGIVAGVVERALEAVCKRGGCEPRDVAAAVGPAIGACCYEVGPEVLQAFEGRGLAPGAASGGRVDIGPAVAEVLEREGVGRERISACGLCTSCNPELFFSHRRDGGLTGRQAGLVWLER